MAVNHNTTSLSANPRRYQRDEYEGGTLGTRYFNNSIARQASVAISRDTFRKTFNSVEMRDFREVIYKMVESWSTEDKLIIINNYGDSSQLQQYKTVTPEIINAVCTESIIIHMDPADLRQLKADMARKKEKLKSDIRTLMSPPGGKYKPIKKYFNTETFEELYQQLKNAKTPREYTNFRKKFDPSYTIPRSLRRNYQTLRNELNEVLKSCFNKLELTTIAFQMGIEINQTMKQKDIILAIINKTCLFVDLIIGKGKANYGNAFMAIDPFKQVLKYTSYAYVLGDPSIDPNQWIELKRNAQRAKRTILERSRIQNSRKNITRRFNKTFNSITGGMGALTTTGLAHQIRMNDRGILQNVSTEELLELAGRYGIDISRERRVNVIKAKLYSAIYSETKRVNMLRRNERLLEGIGRGTNRYASDLLSAHSGMPSVRRPENIATKIKEEKLLEEFNQYGYNIPTVEFLQSGIRKTPNILAAVPVYVVGYGHAGGLNKAESEGLSSSYEVRSGKSLKSPFSATSLKSPKKEKIVLNKNDEELLNMILSMPYNISTGSISSSDHIDSLSKLADNILIPNALKIFEQIILDVYTIAGKGEYIDFSKLTDPSSKINISNAMLLLKPDLNPDILNSIRIRYAYAYAAYRKRYSLCNYITENYGISYDTRRLKFESGISGIIKKIPKFIKNIFKATTIIERTFSAIKTKITAVKNPTNRADLSESARVFYDELNSIPSDSSSLVILKDRLIAKKKINIKIINYYTVALTTSNNTSLGLTPENSKNIAILFLKAAISYAEGQVQCYNLFKYEIQQSIMYSDLPSTDASSLISEIFSDLSILFSSAYGKVFKPFKRLADSVKIGAKGLGEIFRSRGKSELGYGTSVTPKDDIVEGATVVPESLRATHSSILKIEKLLSSTNDILIKLNNGVTEKFDGILAKEDIKIETLKAIYETLKTMAGSSSTTPASSSISTPIKDAVSKKSSLGKLKDLADAYNKHFGLSGDEIMDSSGRVLLTNKANAQEAMVANGMKMTLNSDPISSLDMSKRNIFKVTRKAIDWAIKNDKRFATGGITDSVKFITGDASGSNIFANGAKPELVETFSNGPVISKITPLKNEMEVHKEYELERLVGTVKRANFFSKEAESKGKVTKLFNSAAIPVYITNDLNLKENNNRILKLISSLGFLLNYHLSDIKFGLSNEVVSAPMGVGVVTRPTLMATGIQDKVLSLLDTAAKLIVSPLQDIFEKANTGGTIRTGKSAKFGRLPTGGMISSKNSVSAITGDAPGSNIFANGAKPELVTSSTDLKVTPLNKESKASRNKTERMNLSERKNALATGITSHIIKYNYKLPDNAEDVSNVGEAIKVFNVKPGISDLINLNGTDVSLIQLLSQIYAQLIALNSAKQTDEALLTTIAANSGKTTNTIAANPFTGSFTNSLNTILGGD